MHVTCCLSFVTTNASINHVNEDGGLKMDGTKIMLHVLLIWAGSSVGVA